MRKLLLIFFSLCLFASVEGQMIKRANGNARVHVSGDLYGEELLPDPNFSSTANWYEFGGWACNAGTATVTNGTADAYFVNTNSSITTAGKTYKVEYTITAISGTGSVGVSIAGAAGTARTTTGTFTDELTATGSDYLYVSCSATISVTMTYLSLKEKL